MPMLFFVDPKPVRRRNIEAVWVSRSVGGVVTYPKPQPSDPKRI